MPPSVPTWRPNSPGLIEAPDSPSFVFAERITKTRSYGGRFEDCAAFAVAKGTIGTGEEVGYWVARCEVTRQPGAAGRLVIAWEAISGDLGYQLPPDEFGIEPFEANPALENHPLYQGISAESLSNVHKALNGDDDAELALTQIPDPTAWFLLRKLRRGTTNWYVAGFRYTWVLHSWGLPAATKGGFLQTPGGPLEGALPAGIAWLRYSDQLSYQNGVFRLTRTWLGGPDGFWDPELYI